jgi:hypothetical protein
MKKTTLIFSSFAVTVAAAVIISLNSSEAKPDLLSDATGFTYTKEQVKHGEYLVTSIGCDDCHSPKVFGPTGPELDMSRRLSGRRSDIPLPKADTSSLKSWMLFAHDLTAAVGPWGASFSANITSDATGIGNWSFEQFKTALRKGKYKGLEEGRDLLPPMPWPQYKNLTDEDLKAIFAFLKSTKPVKNIVPAPIAPQDLK